MSVSDSMNATMVYADCANNNMGDVEGLLTCLTNHALLQDQQSQAYVERNTELARNIYVLISASMVFFMQAGFAMVCAGAVRKKNLQNTMLKNLLDACGASIAFYVVGWAFAFGDNPDKPNGFIGTQGFFLTDVDDLALFLFQYAFSAASATIVAGTLAERCQMTAYFYYSILLSGFVYPIAAHAIWSEYGFLSSIHAEPLFGVGVVDIAGSGVVHLLGGFTAMVATYVLGPRRGRFHDEQTGEPLDKPKNIQGHNIGMQLLGTLILWFGWYGFNPGSAYLYASGQDGDTLAVLAAANTTLAAGSAGLSTLFINYFVERRISGKGQYKLVDTMNGVLAGLVAITAPCGVVKTWAAVVIGVVAGLVYLLTSWMLVSLRLDDAVDAIPVHMFNGIWGMLSVGLFAAPEYMVMSFGSQAGNYPGLFYAGLNGRPNGSLLAAQCCGTLFCMAWPAAVMFPFFVYLEQIGSFRVSAREEVSGLDKAYFGNEAAGANGEVDQDQIAQLTSQVEEQLRRRRVHIDEDDVPKTIGSSAV